MDLFKLKKIERRILEIKHTLRDEVRRENMAHGKTMQRLEGELVEANRPLLAELEELETKRTFAHDNRNLVINLMVNLFTVATALFIAFKVPQWEITLQQKSQEEADIQSLYQTIIANEDIFISNYSAIKYSKNNDLPIPLPEFHIEFPIEENIHQIIQKELGIDQYRFLLYNGLENSDRYSRCG